MLLHPKLFVAALLTCVAVPSSAAQTAPQYLGAVNIRLEAVEATSGHLSYRYRIVNPSASRAGVAVVAIDLSAPAGTGHQVLPATGAFTHWPSRRTKVRAIDHVPTGPITPDRWEASLNVEGRLRWYGVDGGSVVDDRIVADDDNVAPGTTLAGFGVRSTWLPGIREFRAEPNWLACCSQPRAGSDDAEHPQPAEFAITGFVVAPSVPPAALNIGTVLDQLTRACQLGWISNDAVCFSLAVKLQQAARSLEEAKPAAARDQLGDFLIELEDQHGTEPGKHVNDSAYWLLRTNAEQLRARL
jgi:hypothetical protein